MTSNLLDKVFDQLPGFVGWKDTSLHHLGCNQNLAAMLRLKHPSQIIGLKDKDLIDHTEESESFHYKNDLLALQGNTVSGIHKSSHPYENSLYYFVKKPLFDGANHICGIIYHCTEFKTPEPSSVNLEATSTPFVWKPLPPASHNPSLPIQNKFKLSNRELECLYYILRGKSAKQIAETMSLSKRTIESYVENIKNKCGSHTKADLLVLAISNGYMNYIPKGTSTLLI
jgi:DNA-binding CsgD family transcriptional regulator